MTTGCAGCDAPPQQCQWIEAQRLQARLSARLKHPADTAALSRCSHSGTVHGRSLSLTAAYGKPLAGRVIQLRWQRRTRPGSCPGSNRQPKPRCGSTYPEGRGGSTASLIARAPYARLPLPAGRGRISRRAPKPTPHPAAKVIHHRIGGRDHDQTEQGGGNQSADYRPRHRRTEG